MNEEFLRYYAGELDFVRQMGAEFASLYPQVASRLQLDASQCADPHVERMIEAFAFLTARVRKKIDDEYPEITDALLSVVYPHYQRPLPSMAIVQYVPPLDATKMTAGQRVPRHVEMTSPPTSVGPPCRFRSAYEVTLWPVAVDSASLASDRVTIPGKPAGAVALLRLGLLCTSPGGWASLGGLDSLRFYLHGGEPVPTSLYESLFGDLLGVWLRGKVVGGGEETVVLPLDSVEPAGFAPDEAALPYPARSFPGYRLLQEYLAFPPKFLFFDLKHLDRIRTAKFEGPVEVYFFLKQAPRIEVGIRSDNFRLGCSPIANLFETRGEPFRLDRLRTSYTVVPKHEVYAAHEVFSVDKVISSGSYLDGVEEYHPFYASGHSPDGGGSKAYYFATRRPSNPKRQGPRRERRGDTPTEVELSFVNANFAPTLPSAETITTHLTCTNGDLPSRLPFGGGDVYLQLESEAPVGQVRLLNRPTRTHRPPTGRSAQWSAIGHLGANFLSLVESPRGAEALRELLTTYDFARSDVTRKMIEGIVDVRSDRVPGRVRRATKDGRPVGNGLCLGLEVTVQFDEESAGPGAFLTASVLERFLGAYATINSFTQMVAAGKQRGGDWKRWPPRCGDRTLL